MKKIDLTRVFFLITSLIIIISGFLIPNTDLKRSIIWALVIIALVVFDIKAPKIVKLSEDNPKIKTVRFLNRLTMSIVTIYSIFTMLSPIESLLAPETNKLVLVGLGSIFIMVFGNLSPKIPFNRYLGLRLPWTIRDEDTWKAAHRVVGYLSFPIAIAMFALSFFFSTDKVVPICILIWIIVPSIYSLVFYYKKVKGMNI